MKNGDVSSRSACAASKKGRKYPGAAGFQNRITDGRAADGESAESGGQTAAAESICSRPAAKATEIGGSTTVFPDAAGIRAAYGKTENIAGKLSAEKKRPESENGVRRRNLI